MKGHVPIEIPARDGQAVKAFQELVSRKTLRCVQFLVANVPVVLQGNEDAGGRRKLPYRHRAQAHGTEVIDGKLLQGDVSHIVPIPMAVDFVAYNIIDDAPVGEASGRITVR